MNDKSKRRGLGLVGKAKSPKLPKNVGKMIAKLQADLKDAKKKLTVHQEPKSKLAAGLRSMMDQPRKKKVRSPHTDKKNERRINPKYKDIFKKKPRG